MGDTLIEMYITIRDIHLLSGFSAKSGTILYGLELNGRIRLWKDLYFMDAPVLSIEAITLPIYGIARTDKESLLKKDRFKGVSY